MLQSATDLLSQELAEWKDVYDAAAARARTPEFRAAAEVLVQRVDLMANAGAEAGAEEPAPLPPPLEIVGKPPTDAADFVTGATPSPGMPGAARACRPGVARAYNTACTPSPTRACRVAE